MEAVAANPVGIELGRQRQTPRFLGHSRMKGGVETGNLRQLRQARGYRADRREVMRLVMGRQRIEPHQFVNRGAVEADGYGEFCSAMNDAMADAGQVFGVTVLLQPIEQAGDSGVVIGQGGGRRLGLSGDDKRRVAADAGDLALDPRAASERQLAERELDAG